MVLHEVVPEEGIAARNYFYDLKPGWEDTGDSQVKQLFTVQKSLREMFAPVTAWTEVAGVSLHIAIVSAMLDTLKKAEHVVDLGCGTGSLMAIFIELVPQSCVVEGLEYDPGVAERAEENVHEELADFFSWGPQANSVAQKVASAAVIRGQVQGEGDAFKFNADGKQNGVYDVLNVGFSMMEEDLRKTHLWNATAVGGKLGVPICDAPLATRDTPPKCKSRYHVFTKLSRDDELLGAKMAVGAAHHVIDKEIRFVLIRPES